MKTLMHTRVKTSTHKPKTSNSTNKKNHNTNGGGKRNVDNIGIRPHKSGLLKPQNGGFIS